jgi:hypothetical protein
MNGTSEAKEAGKRLGLIVIEGEEITGVFSDFSPMHVVALWINSTIPPIYEVAKTDRERIESYFQNIHSQNGIGIVAHPWIAGEWSIVNWTDSSWYPYRSLECIDGWEVYFNFESSVYDEYLEKSFITLDHDFHRGAVPLDEYTILFAHNRTEEGVREALLSKRNVAFLKGQVYGTREALMLAYQYGIAPSPMRTLTIESVPRGIMFAVAGVSNATPWSWTYYKGTSINLVMPESQTFGGGKYYWSQWSDGDVNRSRTVTMDTNVTLTAYYTGPYYELTVTSSPMTGVTFTVNGVPKTTPYTEWLLEGSYTLRMPKTHDGYVWSHWLEDGGTGRIKTIILSDITWTGVFIPEPSPPPVGGYSFPTKEFVPTLPLTPYLALIAILTISFTAVKRKIGRKTK